MPDTLAPTPKSEPVTLTVRDVLLVAFVAFMVAATVALLMAPQ